MAHTDRTALALELTSTAERGYFHIRASVRVLDADGLRVSSPEYDTATVRGLYLRGMRLASQGHAPYEGTSTAGRLYAWEYGYDVSGLVNEKVAAMAKTIKAIDARLAKISAARGSAESYAEYVCRFAEAIGARVVLRWREGANRSYPGYETRANYRELDLAQARYEIGRLEADWRERVMPAQVAS